MPSRAALCYIETKIMDRADFEAAVLAWQTKTGAILTCIPAQRQERVAAEQAVGVFVEQYDRSFLKLHEKLRQPWRYERSVLQDAVVQAHTASALLYNKLRGYQMQHGSAIKQRYAAAQQQQQQ